MSTVKETHGMCCPQCKKDESIRVSAAVWVSLHPDGTENDSSDCEWDSECACYCTACGFQDRVSKFRVEDQE